jgi:hypothetical protein
MQPVRREETGRNNRWSFGVKVKQPVLDPGRFIDERTFDGDKLRLLFDFGGVPLRNVVGSRIWPNAFRAAKNSSFRNQRLVFIFTVR